MTEMGFYFVADVNAASILNSPFQNAFHLYVFRADTSPNSVERTLQIITLSSVSDSVRALLYRKHNNFGWSKWTQLATIDPPTWYNLPLASGYTNSSVTPQYCKDQWGFVHLKGRVTNVATLSAVFATLPSGYRPSSSLESRSIAQSAGAENAGTARMEIQSNGNIIIAATSSLSTLSNWIDISCSFYAG